MVQTENQPGTKIVFSVIVSGLVYCSGFQVSTSVYLSALVMWCFVISTEKLFFYSSGNGCGWRHYVMGSVISGTPGGSFLKFGTKHLSKHIFRHNSVIHTLILLKFDIHVNV